MPDILDVFKSDFFNMVSMTDAINKVPHQPGRLAELNLFQQQRVTTPVVVIEERHGRLELIPTTARGAHSNFGTSPKRQGRSLIVPHLQQDDVIMADDVAGIREFGSSTAMETVAGMVNDRLENMRDNHEVTHEWHRMGVLKGDILDADNTTSIYDLFTEYGITQDAVTFDISDGGFKTKAHTIKRNISKALGGTTFTRIHVLCSASFFDSFVEHAEVKAAYDRWRDGEFLRTGHAYSGFDLWGITWEEYRGTMDGTDFLAANKAVAFPIGVRNLFKDYVAPAPFVETVNTLGRPFYAKQERMKWNNGVDIHTNSNHLFWCTRPKVIQDLTIQA